MNQHNNVVYSEVDFGDETSGHLIDGENVYLHGSLAQSVDDGVRLWFDCLFEPTDIIEFRCFPSKEVAKAHSPHQFLWRRTWRHHQFDPWTEVDWVDSLFADLSAFNNEPGITTFWGQEGEGRWLDIKTISHLPLNIYCSANPRRQAGGSKAGDVALARCLFVDLDHVTVEQATQLVDASGLPQPTLTVNSGHGVHLYWRLHEPITDLGHWTTCQKRLISILDSDDIHDPPRVMRVPGGFLNLNGVPAQCQVVEGNPDRRYDLAELMPILPVKLANPPSTQAKSTNEAPQLLPDHRIERALAYQQAIPPAETGSRNSDLFRLATELVEKFNLNEQQLGQVIRTFSSRSAEPLGDTEVEQVVKKAHRHVHAKHKPLGTALANQLPIQHYQEPVGELVTLENWRNQMKASRIESLDHLGTINFDASTTGAGKSTADQALMKLAKSSITFLPTHDACQELAQALKASGIDVAAYPDINKNTCLRFDEAKKVISTGLNVGQTLCAGCELAKKCEYQRQREHARNEPHAIATHARASCSDFEPAQGKQVVFIHEEAIPLLRPTAKIDSPRHLKTLLTVAHEAADIAKTWDDKKKSEFADSLIKSINQLLDLISDETRLTTLQDAHDLGIDHDLPPRVVPLPLKERRSRPDRLDNLIYRAVQDAHAQPDNQALRLVMAHACGELASLCLVVDDKFEKGGRKTFHNSLVAVWNVDLPEGSVVWLENASANHQLLAEMVKRPIIDRTPQGRLATTVPIIQYADRDITQTTAPGVIRSVMRGILLSHPEAKKVGVITHRCHLPAFKALEPFWSSRITRTEYFRSGKDRASNSWLENDLLVILGTPRVPPSAVRQGLIQLNKIERAGADGVWKPFIWEGRTTDGRIIQVESVGYQDPSWAAVHSIQVKDTLLQAIGRGRSVTDKGIPVVVVTNECLDLELAAAPLPLVNDSIAQTLQACVELSLEHPNIIYVGKTSVSTSDVSKRTGTSQPQVREHFKELITQGLLKRKGERGGVMLTDLVMEGAASGKH